MEKTNSLCYLQYTFKEKCITNSKSALEMFEFCQKHLKGIGSTYLKDEEIIQHHNSKLLDRFENCNNYWYTRSFHYFFPVSQSNLKCFITSQATEYEINFTSKAVQITLHIKDSIACVYDGQWWLAEMNVISDINENVLVTFYHPIRPSTAFKKKQEDQTWLPINNFLRKLSALELYWKDT
ncbi:hypothetical protein AVEN_220330-1 [Araneus ventricosus]|uniref:Uncharacterized protein n=1 Tax=Araneus ventricosus TaxID=182803 RepID=A0A4Y2T279_ARAVE|nr:hypothetical protein AVEN_220330-1 [Araneus ventricosus]